MTSTNHHPFDVPKEYKLNKGNSVKDRYREAVYYTDAMLGEFLSRISHSFGRENYFLNNLENVDEESIKDALLNSVYKNQKNKIEKYSLNFMIGYFIECVKVLESTDMSLLREGVIKFPNPERLNV